MNDPIKTAPFVSPDVAALRARVHAEAIAAAVSAIRGLTRSDRARDIDPSYRQGVADAALAVENLRAGVAR